MNRIKTITLYFFCFPGADETDFDLSTIGSSQTEAHTKMFASSGFYANEDDTPCTRGAVDDIESLVYSMWYVAGIPVGRPYFADEKPEGMVLAQCKRKDEIQGSTLAEFRLKVCGSISSFIGK